MTSSGTIAIIGGGASGSLLAIHLLRQAQRPVAVTLIERSTVLAAGLAYQPDQPDVLLNVRALNMSALPDDPRHFINWLISTPATGYTTLSPDVVAPLYVPRALYGQYLRETLATVQQSSNATLDVITDEVTFISPGTAGWQLHLHSGQEAIAHDVVLATGNGKPDWPVTIAGPSPRLVGDPYNPPALAGIDRDAPVMIIGTGLTMVDVCMVLRHHGHRGPIHAISRHGLLPAPHLPLASPPVTPVGLADLTPLTARVALHLIRATCQTTAAQGDDWRAAFDGVRPLTPQLWQRLPQPERERFLRHARTYWDSHRHRMPPASAKLIVDLQESGQLVLHSGSLIALAPSPERVTVTWQDHRTESEHAMDAGAVVNCTGIQTDITRIPHLLLQQLLRDQIITPDPLRLGIASNVTGQVIGPDGATHAGLFALGPLTRGTFWEITAIPEIRVQAETMARLLLEQR